MGLSFTSGRFGLRSLRSPGSRLLTSHIPCRGNRQGTKGKVLDSPTFMPRTASSNSSSIWPSPSGNWKPSPCRHQRARRRSCLRNRWSRDRHRLQLQRQRRWAKLRRCLRRISMVLSMAASFTSALTRSISASGVRQSDTSGMTSKTASNWTDHQRARPAFSDGGLTSHAQVGFVSGLGKTFAQLVVQHFVLNRVAITLSHHVHRHLAGRKPSALDGAGQASSGGQSTSFLRVTASEQVMRRSSFRGSPR